MNILNNTVLITGGSAGIGLEIAKLFANTNNKVIITGRDPQRLRNALQLLPNTVGILSDVSSEKDSNNLVATIKKDHPHLNIVVNNAGRAHLYNLAESENAFEKAQDEMLTNYLSIIRLNEKLLPVLNANDNAAIVNVSSVVAFVPGSLPTYSASKAALHSYTRSLRRSLALAGEIKVFELMPPLVNTELSQAIGGSRGIPPSQVAEEFFESLKADNYEIRVGNTQHIYALSLSDPAGAFELMNPA